MKQSHPYQDAPDYRYWRRAVASPSPSEVDPVVRMPFLVSPKDRVATAGSCFAQHIARHLRESGFTYLVTEPGHPILPRALRGKFNYGTFSARFGNIYTSRQLVQLVDRAYGDFAPIDSVWEEDNSFVDPYRPTIQPGGFPTMAEFLKDRDQHFAAVRQMLEQADVFVFTMGLTEGWMNAVDGAVYPVCPGASGGRFDPAVHQFFNESVDDVVSNMRRFIARLREINSSVRIILTVSPVPLAATAMDRHVLVSTTYSKSVLRVAAEALTQIPNVAYFPSYEIITGAYNRGCYFADNLRDVLEDGVQHVMRLFFRHATKDFDTRLTETEPASDKRDDFIEKSTAYVDVICEEELLDAGLR